MQKNIFETMIMMNQTALETLKKITEANIDISGKLMRQQMDMAQSMMEESATAAEDICACKTMQDFTEKQSGCAEDVKQNILQSAQGCADILAEANQTYTSLIEEGMNAFGQSMAQNNKASKSNKKAA